MKRAVLLQEIRKMRFEEAYDGWMQNRLTQEEAAQLLGVSDRTFRRYLCRYEKEGLDALTDKRISQVSHRRAPVDELIALTTLYQGRYFGWNVKHFFRFYRKKHAGKRSYGWVSDQRWDLIVTMDDATSEHYSMFFVEEESTATPVRGFYSRKVVIPACL